MCVYIWYIFDFTLSIHTAVWCLQKEVNVESFGPTMADLEKQIASHNILHKQLEAYSPQLSLGSVGNKVGVSMCLRSCFIALRVEQAIKVWKKHLHERKTGARQGERICRHVQLINELNQL